MTMNSAYKNQKEEAESTVRKKEDGSYFDISENVLTKKGITNLTDKQLEGLFGKLRLRYSLTPRCNIWCVFCSNEGLMYDSKGKKPANVDLVTKLGDLLLENTPLKSIDFSGGEPTIHPDLLRQEYRLLDWAEKHPDTRFSLHSNGIELRPDLINRIKSNFSRIGVSINSVFFDNWNKISNMEGMYPKEVQERKFNKMMDNLEYLASQNIGDKVFLKSVVVRGINDSKEELSALLETSVKYNFHPKFLQFDPQYPSQRSLQVGRGELFSKLEKLGCTFADDVPRDNNPQDYIPGVNFTYSGAPIGLHSIFGCGDEAVCLSCYDFLCMFVKPTDNGEGLYLKPCSVLDTRVDLTHAIKKRDVKQLLDLFKMSREYLMLAPGLDTDGWNKEKEYDFNRWCDGGCS